MGDKVIRETHAGTETVRGRKLTIERLEWRDAEGDSYDVTDAGTGELLTMDESFDSYPSRDQLEALLDSQEP